MKRIPLWLYLLIFFLIPHIRWLSPLTSSRHLPAVPYYISILFAFFTPLLFKSSSKSVLVHFLVILAALALSCLPYLAMSYWAESGVVYVLLFCMPIVGLGAPLMLGGMDNIKFARAVILVLAAACLAQTIYMTVESADPSILTLVRPNAEGEDISWFYSNRYGTSRTMYTLTDPMSAGAWAWFTGITLLVLAPLAKFGRFSTLGIQMVGALVIGSIILTLSRGPAVVAVLSLVCLALLALTSLKKALAIGIVGFVILAISLYTVLRFNSQLANSLFELAVDAFSGEELGNAERLDAWANGLNSLSEGGNGLHTISFMQGHSEVNFENTFLNLTYAAGIQGLLYSFALIATWVVFTAKLAINLYHQKWKSPQDKLRLAWAVGWFFYMFTFPCLRNIDCAFITFSILGALLFTQSSPKEVEFLEEKKVRHPEGVYRVVMAGK